MAGAGEPLGEAEKIVIEGARDDHLGYGSMTGRPL
jgi:hypothetical protein